MPDTSSDTGYEAFLRGLDLIVVELNSCASAIDRVAMREVSQAKSPARLLSENYKTKVVHSKFFDAVGEFEATISATKDSTPAVSIRCEFEAHFHTDENASKAHIERFVRSEFQFVVLPYARQFISATTAQMGIRPVTIPLSTRTGRNIEPATKRIQKGKG